jgi:nitrite reductase (NADH) large subunit
LAYDALVLATGAQPIRLPIPGADGPGVIAYRTLDDVRAMLAHAGTGGSAVVIGGGLLGLEAAAGLARRGASVTVLQAAGWLMNRQLDRTAAGLLQQRLEAQGIAVITHATTTAIEPGAVLLSDGRRIPGGIVVMAAGIRPDTALAAAAGLAVGRGILVDDAMRTDDPAVWAIGECAEHDGTLIGLVAPALAQADIAAASILGGVGRYAAVSGSTALKVAGAGVWSAGDIDDGEVIILQDPAAGQYRRLVIRGDRLVGAMLYGETADAIWYMGLIKQCQPLGDIRGILPFGPAYARMETAA